VSDMGFEIRAVLGALALCGLAGTAGAAGAGPATLAVEFRLTDLDDRPLPGVPVRLVLGSAPDWQSAGAGHRFVTDEGGMHRMAVPVVLEEQWRKRPTNFLSSLASRAQQTDHLRVAVELPYMTFGWLYALDVHRFRGSGDVLLEGFSVYTRDARGQFTTKAKHDGRAWMMADLGGAALTHPGHEPGTVMLEPDPADPGKRRWTLRITFKRAPAPVRR
jgi:hypothetical protein